MRRHFKTRNKYYEHIPQEKFEGVALKVSLVSIIGNFVLSLFKMFAGIFAHSSAMVSDAIHSISDVFSSIIVIIGVKISSKASDKDHPYGHERFECVAAIVLAVILLISGLFIGYNAIDKIISGDFETLKIPGIVALIAAIVSIVAKEIMYWYTRFHAKRLDSGALMADAWHHRSDALSSVGALIGIVFARMGYPIIDVIASFIICLFIIKASVDIFKDAINKMVDRSCNIETEKSIIQCAEKQPGVIRVDLINTRMFGNRIYVDIEICAQRDISLAEGHDIASSVHDAIETSFPKVKHVMVHVNPSEENK